MAGRDQMPDRASARGLAGSTTGSIGGRLEADRPFDRAGAFPHERLFGAGRLWLCDVLVKGFVDEGDHKGATIMIYTHQTAPTHFVDAAGVRFAYRRFGKSGGVPIVFNQHYIGTMDYWDPAVTDGLARDREVILCQRCDSWSPLSRTQTPLPKDLS